MSDLKASISKIMCRMLTAMVVLRRYMLVSRRTSLIISNSEPSPPPGAVWPIVVSNRNGYKKLIAHLP